MGSGGEEMMMMTGGKCEWQDIGAVWASGERERGML